jgi:tRNA/tmRNA/rRNA uracil-C5-methylase (TrmA/RlmC/RlmD family)
MDHPVEVEIHDVAYGGDGVGRLADGRAVFVPFSAVGDRLLVRLAARHRRFARATIEQVIEPGPGRVEPRCPYYGECGGCCYQHLAADEQVRQKVAQLRHLLARIGGVPQLPPLDEARPAPEVYGYRNKIVLKPVLCGSRLAGWGYTRRDNVSVLPIESCPIARPELNARLAGRSASGEAARWPSGRKPESEKLVLRCSSSGELLVFGSPPATLLTERVLDLSLRVPAGGFFQVNPPVLGRLAGWLRKAYRGLSVETLVDGYCGCGVFALCLAELTSGEVIGIESDRASIRCAEENARAAGLEQCRFVGGAVEDHLESALKAAPHLDRAAVLLDPPRAGCSAEALATLMRLTPRTIILLSCNPATLARDLARLRVGKFHDLRRLALFDMFPQTAYFEAVAILIQHGGTEDMRGELL